MRDRAPARVALLEKAPTRRMERHLYRCVPYLVFVKGEPPRFLYSSGRPGRCNPASIQCLYFADTRNGADREYLRLWKGTPAERQPQLLFQAKVRFRHVLDLADPKVLEALDLDQNDLGASWRGEPLTNLQQIGRAVSEQTRIAAIRYPSAALVSNWNIAIFPDAIEAPDRVEILGDSKSPLELIP